MLQAMRTLTCIAWILINIVPFFGEAFASDFHYDLETVTRIAKTALPPNDFDVIAVPISDRTQLERLIALHPFGKKDLTALYSQDASAYSVPGALRTPVSRKNICYIFYAANNNAPHKLLRTSTAWPDSKVQTLIVTHEASHCMIHIYMTENMNAWHPLTQKPAMAWFPPKVRAQVPAAPVGKERLRDISMSGPNAQRWTESLADLFTANLLIGNQSLTTADMKIFADFRLSATVNDPQHGTGGALQAFGTILQALQATVPSWTAYWKQPLPKQHGMLLEIVSIQANKW